MVRKGVTTALVVVIVLAVISIGLVVGCGMAQQGRPRRVSNSSSTTTIQVKRGQSLQAAIDQAKYGATIILEAGATYESPYSGATREYGFRLPDKGPGTGTDADYITIRT